MAKQAERLLCLSLKGQHEADRALLLVGSKRDLAAQVKMSPTTITNFFKGRPVARQKFLKICQALKLKSQEVIEPVKPETNLETKVATLVQRLRQQIQPYIQWCCGTMKVLNMTQPIGLGEIYTEVNILEKVTANRRLELEDLLALGRVEGREAFDRFGLGQVAEKRKPGLEVVQQYPRLIVLGRPGAGKTTFLKYLAIECISGNHFADRVPLFVTLKDFAEAPNQPDLVGFLATLLPNSEMTELLSAGKALILLDGLDEVQETDSRRVNQQIRSFAERFHTNVIAVTCRIAAKAYTFEQFVEVEVADFNPEQIKIFVTKWFQAKQPQKAERFLERLKEHEPIQELATNPLLLTLLCLIFKEKNTLPKKRYKLYQEGIDLLLKRWDKTRLIDRDWVYKQLPLKQRKNLLSKIALHQFERQEYFFESEMVESLIGNFLGQLEDDLDIEEDSRAVLESIEAQHGLLTKRAAGIYSFSHLTFHEYFAALEIKQKSRFDLLVKNITEPHWREVFLLTAEMLTDADELVQLMKQQIDSLLSEDEQLQKFLNWLQQKSNSVKAPYELPAIRAFYFARAYIFVRPVRSHELLLFRDFACDHNRVRVHVQEVARDLARDFAQDRNLARVFQLARDLDLALAHDLDPELKPELAELRGQLSDISWDDQDAFKQWWQVNGEVWIEKLRTSMNKYHSVDCDWQFSKKQRQLLRQYYDANMLLIGCLSNAHYVSRNVREEIEATLLLPVASLPPKSPTSGGL